MIRLTLYILSFFVFQNLIAQKPDWIDDSNRKQRFPSEIFLQGFWSAAKNADESKESLLKRLSGYAKNQIIESITVNIKSNSSLKTESSGSSFNQTFQEEISTFSDAALFGLKYDVYFNDKTNTGYAFAYVNKNELIKYHVNLIYEQYEYANQKLSNCRVVNNQNLKQIITSLYSCLNIVAEIKRSENMLVSLNASDVKTVSYNQTIGLERDIKQEISDIFNRIKITPYNTTILPTLNTTWQFPISVEVLFDNNQIEGMPLYFYSGSTKIGQAFTDKSSHATLILNKLPSSVKEKHIISKFDLQALINSDTIDIAKKSVDFVVPSSEFVLTVKKIPVYISQNEYCNNIIPSKLKEVLAKSGFEFTTNENIARYQIQISCNTHGKNVSGLQFVYVDATLELIDNLSGNTIYQNKIQDCKGGGSDWDSASNKAFQNASDKISDTLVQFLSK